MKLYKTFCLTCLILLSCLLIACKKVSVLDIQYNESIFVGDVSELIIKSSIEDDEIVLENLNPNIISLEDYNVKGLREGIAVIKVISSYETIEIIEIYVSDKPTPNSISLEIIGDDFVIGKEYQLKVNILPNNASKEVVFKYSTNNLIIDEDKLTVTFLNAGKQSINCLSKKNKNVYAYLEVDVDFNPEIETYQILYIGNSMTKYHHDIPSIVEAMMKEKGLNVKITVDDPAPQYIIDHKTNFNKYMQNNKYTHVVLQEKSSGTLTDYNKFEAAVLEFKDIIDENGAKLVLYQTWAYNQEWSGYTRQQMCEVIKNAYTTVADKTNAILLPSGDAFWMYESTYGTDISLYEDINHPSEYGAFLSACVHYAKLTGRKASDVEYIYSNINEEIANQIKAIADKVVYGE